MEKILIAAGGANVSGANNPPAGPGSPEDKGYETSCRIKGGEAVGVIRNLSSEALRYSGSVSFYFYDDKGAMIDENLTMEAGTVRPYESKTLVNNGIALRAESCGLDISAAMERRAQEKKQIAKEAPAELAGSRKAGL